VEDNVFLTAIERSTRRAIVDRRIAFISQESLRAALTLHVRKRPP